MSFVDNTLASLRRQTNFFEFFVSFVDSLFEFFRVFCGLSFLTNTDLNGNLPISCYNILVNLIRRTALTWT